MVDTLRGSRVLIVEDDGIIALDLQSTLEEAGCVVVALESRIEAAEALARTEELDLALLDVQINGSTSFDVADILAARGIPFVFLTGYSPDALPDRFGAGRIIRKPFSPKRLLASLERLTSGASLSGK
jgi:CheY-like chemotaxis protein